MSGDNSGWVLTADRKPTADDADEDNDVYAMSGGVVVKCCYVIVGDEWRGLEQWHPKPKAEKPAPYKPPVPERVEGYVNVYGTGHGGWLHRTEEQARKNRGTSERIAHVREVRDGDPSPEDVEKAVELVRSMKEYGTHRESFDAVIRLLGGTP